MNQNTPDFPRRELTAEERASRDAYVAAKLEAECKQKRLVAAIGFSSILIAVVIGYFLVQRHQTAILAQNAARVQQQASLESAKAQEEILKARQETEQFYAGKVQAYDSIMGSRNLIPGYPVRPRAEIEFEIRRVLNAISEIKARMKSSVNTQNYSYRDSNGRSGSGTSYSYNSAEMDMYLKQIREKEAELTVLQAELRRDDYFTGRVAGNEL